MKTCVICGKQFEGYGNNPEPVKSYDEGQCCDECDCLVVIPRRCQDMRMTEEAAMAVGQMELNMRRFRKDNPEATIEDLIRKSQGK